MRTTLRLPALLLLSALSACNDGTGPDEQTPASIEIANATLTLDSSLEGATLQVRVLDQDGIEILGAQVFFSSEEPAIAGVDADGVVTAFSNGTTTIEASIEQITATAEVTVAIESTPIELGVPVDGLSGPRFTQYYFSVTVPEGDGSLRVLEVKLGGGIGDADLLARHELQPTPPDNFACYSGNEPISEIDNPELCAIPNPASGIWHFIVFGFDAFQDVELVARVVDAEELASGTAIDGVEADSFEFRYFRTSVVQGESLKVETTGGSGDADLYLVNVPAISLNTLREAPCISDNVGNGEECEITALPEGEWTVILFAYEAFDGLSLTPTITPGEGGVVRRAERWATPGRVWMRGARPPR